MNWVKQSKVTCVVGETWYISMHTGCSDCISISRVYLGTGSKYTYRKTKLVRTGKMAPSIFWFDAFGSRPAPVILGFIFRLCVNGTEVKLARRFTRSLQSRAQIET
jgi:hypothetical protein